MRRHTRGAYWAVPPFGYILGRDEAQEGGSTLEPPSTTCSASSLPPLPLPLLLPLPLPTSSLQRRWRPHLPFHFLFVSPFLWYFHEHRRLRLRRERCSCFFSSTAVASASASVSAAPAARLLATSREAWLRRPRRERKASALGCPTPSPREEMAEELETLDSTAAAAAADAVAAAAAAPLCRVAPPSSSLSRRQRDWLETATAPLSSSSPPSSSLLVLPFLLFSRQQPLPPQKPQRQQLP